MAVVQHLTLTALLHVLCNNTSSTNRVGILRTEYSLDEKISDYTKTIQIPPKEPNTQIQI